MRVLHTELVYNYCKKHADAKGQLEAWLAEVRKADWKTPNDIKARFVTASFLGESTVIFNIKGNNHRLEVRVTYKNRIVLIEWIGTHAEYDKRNRKRS